MKSQFVSVLFGRGLASVVQAISMILVARSLSVTQFGLVGIVISVGTIASLIGDLGLTTYIARARAIRDEAAVRAGLLLNRWSAAIGGALLISVVIVGALNGGWPWWPLPLLAGFMVEKAVDTASSVLIADGRNITANLALLGRRVVVLMCVVAGSVIAFDAAWTFSVGYLFSAIVSLIYVAISLLGSPDAYAGSRSTTVRIVARETLPYFFSNLTAGVRLLDTAIIASIASPHAAGLYAAASRVTSPAYLIPQTLTTVIMPHAARATGKAVRAMGNRLLLATVGLSIVLAALSPLVIWFADLILGDQYAGAALPLLLLLIGLPWVAASSPFGSLLQSRGQARFVAVNGVVFAVGVVAALIVASLLWGAAGAAAAVGALYAGKTIVLDLKLRRTGVGRGGD
ncbi:oligosaccharide flippase family protein [Curtobacterium pusillum]|uniref:oligosaccharide flippase family protein n=1 Tax=Curtobacterium pusillum TaxID=69373 RepID=UPI0022F2A74E|nr:oligosaccharide flippase family protein [Curtobacterium pusillum]